jgi:type II secretory pathway pseudopilin PulG
MSQPTKTALAVIAIVVAAAAFWLLLLSPKRDKANELSEQVSAAKTTLATEKQRAETGLVAKKKFRRDYQQLVLLGKAVPAEAETASLLVQLNALGRPTSTPFLAIAAEAANAESEETTTTGEPVEETIAQEPPLGSKVGPAGLRAMPSKVGYLGGYFALVELLKHVDGMVTTKDGRVVPDGRLVTIDSFVLKPVDNVEYFNIVGGVVHITSYTTPPDQGLTAGASLAGPAEGSAQ